MNKKDKNTLPGPGIDKISGRLTTDHLAAAPGILLCLVPLLMLLLDIAVDGMDVKQYAYYQTLFKVFNAAAIVCGVIYIICSMRRKDINRAALRRPACIFFAAFMIWIVISTCVNGLTKDAAYGVPFRNIGIFLTFEMVVIIMVVSSRVRQERLRRAVLILYIAAADLIGLASIADLHSGCIEAFHGKKELSAIFFNGNHYGYFLVMAVLISLGLFLYSEEKLMMAAGAVSAVLNLYLLMINRSSGCILAVLAVSLAALIAASVKRAADAEDVEVDHSCSTRLRARIALMTMMVLGIAAAVMLPGLQSELASLSSDISDLLSGNSGGSAGHNRGLLWQTAVQYISEKPVTGHGCEGVWVRMYTEIQRSDPHNEILTYAVYYGIPGALFYTLGVLSVLTERIRKASALSACGKTAALAAAGYFISSLSGVALFYTTPFFFLFLGLSSEYLSE